MGWKDAPTVGAWSSAPEEREKPKPTLEPFEKEALRTSLFNRELMSSPPMALARGVKDVLDTGAELLAAGYDKIRGPTQSSLIAGGEADRVRALNQAGKAEFSEAAGDRIMPKVGRFTGNIAGTVPATTALGGLIAKFLPGLGAAVSTGGATTGAVLPTAAQVGARGAAIAKAADVGVRSLGGAASGAVSAGLVDPESAGTGAAIGGALPVVGQLAKAGAGAARELLGAHSGVGGNALSKAVEAGKTGGQASERFLANLRGEAPMDEALTMAKSNLAAMARARQAQYRSGMVDIKADKAVLDLGNIRQAVNEAAQSVKFKGVATDPQAAKAVSEASREVQKWAIKPQAEYHTPEGLDALKKVVGSIRERIPFEQKNARRAVSLIYDKIGDEITQQAPTYAKVMRDYSQASRQIEEVERSLIGGSRASADTAMRKLQSLMRNNVSTNYGVRDATARNLIEQGGQDFTFPLAGQAMNTWTPRGIQRATAGGTAATLAALGQLPQAAALGAMSSPRLLGESAHLLGVLGRYDPSLMYLAAPLMTKRDE